MLNLYDVDHYNDLCNELKIFTDYYKEKGGSKGKFLDYVLNCLNDFADVSNKKDYGKFDFTLSLHCDSESKYIDFSTGEDCIYIDSGGYVYDPDVGGDSYTDWNFTIWRNGDYSDHMGLNADYMCELLSMGAELDVTEPEEFADYYE